MITIKYREKHYNIRENARWFERNRASIDEETKLHFSNFLQIIYMIGLDEHILDMRYSDAIRIYKKVFPTLK